MSGAGNPYFALETPAGLSGWTPLAALTDAAVLRGRAEQVRHSFGAGPLRAAASVDFLGVSARLLSPVLAALATGGTAPVLTLTNVWWRPAVPGPMRLAATATDHTASLSDAVVAPVVVPLVAAYATTFALSRKVLWGNVGSALNGAAAALGRGRADFHRHTCCLLYRLDSAVCADCVLAGAALKPGTARSGKGRTPLAPHRPPPRGS